MEIAEDGLGKALDNAAFSNPRFPVYSNVTTEPVTNATTARSLLLKQLASPVRWSDEISAIARRHPGALYVEMGPGSVLVGLAKKIDASLKTATCGTAAEVSQLTELAVS
jgi:malonyl CoA-acyl carrier protein transacylase